MRILFQETVSFGEEFEDSRVLANYPPDYWEGWMKGVLDKIMKIECPRCHKLGTGPYTRWVLNSRKNRFEPYYYISHFNNGKQKWCYVPKAIGEAMYSALSNTTEEKVPIPLSNTRAKPKFLPCKNCHKKTKHIRIIDGTRQVWQCTECGHGWLLDYNNDVGEAAPLTPEEIEEHKAIAKVFEGKLLYYARLELPEER